MRKNVDLLCSFVLVIKAFPVSAQHLFFLTHGTVFSALKGLHIIIIIKILVTNNICNKEITSVGTLKIT